jgi:hypothetical protein
MRLCCRALAVGAALAAGYLLPAPARADDWGCQVLLCLSNPGGPTEFAECRPPIERLWRHLRRGRPFPNCAMARSPEGGGSWAQVVIAPYDPCPADLQPAPAGSYVQDQTEAVPAVSEPVPSADDTVSGPGPRACVGTLLRSYATGSSDRETVVSVYDRVVWQEARSPAAIDVYVDDRLHTRVRL